MKRSFQYIKKSAAAFITAAIMLCGCGAKPEAQTVRSEDAPAVSSSAETSAPQETEPVTETEALPEETEELYPKGENIVRTAEELAGKKVIALTFDDGPNTAVTCGILDLLEEYGIKASFFVIGQNINEESAVSMQRAHAMGCEINSHSFTHSYMDKMTEEEIKDEMKRTDDLIYEYVGEHAKFFRPPYIAVNKTMYESIDLPFISGIGCNDWDSKVSVEKRVRFLTMKCPEGSIILLHDQEDNTGTLEALKQAIPMMLEDGFEFVTVSELFVAKGITPSADKEIIYSYATESGQ